MLSSCSPYIVGVDDLFEKVLIYPKVISVSTTRTSGAYGPGSEIPILIEFSEDVIVSGSPQLVLNTLPEKVATYVAGSGSNILEFRYQVADHDSVSSFLDYKNNSALELNNGKIFSLSMLNADLALPLAGDFFGKMIIIDTIAPDPVTGHVWSSTSPSSIATNIATWTKSVSTDLASQKIQFFSNASCGTGSESGSLINLTNAAQTQSFTGVDGGLYSYKVTSIDNAGNLSVSNCSSSIVIDTTVPTIAITSPVAGSWINLANDSATFSVSGTCSEVGRTVSIKSDGVTVGTAPCTGGVFSGNINSTAMTEGAHVLTATISDNAGNNATSAAVNITRDVTVPIASTSHAWSQTSPANTASVTASWTKSVSTDFAIQKIQFYSNASCGAGSESGSLITLTNTAQTQSFTGVDGGTYSYKVTSIDNSGNSTVSSCSSSMAIDTTSAAITSVTSTTNTGTYITGAVVNMIVNFSEAVSVSGTPVLALNTTPARNATYVSGTGTSSLVFNYTVQIEDYSSRLNYTSTSSLILSGGTIRDQAGNNAVLTLPALLTNGLYSKNIVIDAVSPAVTAVNTIWSTGFVSLITACDAESGWCPSLFIEVTYSKSVIVSGNPQLALNVLPATFANYSYGSGTNKLYFEYSLQGDSPTSTTWLNYASTNSLTLNGGAMKDSLGNNAILTLPTPSSSALYEKNIIIDNTPPSNSSDLKWTIPATYDLSPTASWTKSASNDLGTQHIYLYNSSNCSGTVMSTPSVSSAVQTATVTLSSFGGSWSYRIYSYDVAGNYSISGCSTSIASPIMIVGKENSISVQGPTSCAVVNGAAQCWGKAQYGALGNGDGNNNKTTPVQVTGLTTGVQAVATGLYHACALVNGGVKCWGNNINGQLGDGTTTNRTSPVSVSGLTSGVQAIVLGSYFSCALTSGSVKCWGYNDSGQIGNSTVSVGANQLTPVTVSSPLSNNVQDIKAFGSSACALTDGKVYCWGNNAFGQLGNNTTTNSNVPVQVKNSAGSGVIDFVQAITVGGFHACALVNGGVQCWGRNTYYQLGDSTNTQRSLPVAVSGFTNGVQQISAGSLHTCIVVDGVAKCWGYNSTGQVGVNSTGTITTPTSVLNSSAVTMTGVQYVIAGRDNTCALVNGSIRCWGYNGDSQLGDGTTTNRLVATQTTGLTTGLLTAVVGAYHSCAVVNGGVQCWGRNDYGQLGNGTTTNSTTPVIAIAANSGAQDVAVGDFHTCSIVNGGVRCWGRNDKYQVGQTSQNAYYSTPQTYTQSFQTNPPFTTGVQKIVLGEKHSCVLKDGAVSCWGDNSYGIFAYSGIVGGEAYGPYPVSGAGASVGSLYGGYRSACILQRGRVGCWGAENFDPLNNATSVTWGPYGSISGIQTMAANQNHACVVIKGAAECWGMNGTGALGDGTNNFSQGTNVQVSGLSSGVQKISVNSNGSCAIVNGEIKCWGTGFGNTPQSLGIPSGAQFIFGTSSPYNNNTCAIVNGGLQCWGNNSYGQMGNGTYSTDNTKPVALQLWL